MALTDFFRINLPYGLQKNDKNEWFVFNREYKPLGWNTTEFIDETQFPVYTSYQGLTDTSILKIFSDSMVYKNEKGEICKIFLYNDKTNPLSNSKYWEDYFIIIKELSKFKKS